MGNRLATTLPRVGYPAAVASAVVVPVAFARQLADPFMLPKATLLWLAAVVALVGLVADGVARRSWPFPRPRAAAPIGLLVAWTTVATLAAPTRIGSILGGYGRYDGLATLAGVSILGTAVVAATWRRPERLEVLAGAIVASAVAGLAYLLVERTGVSWARWRLLGDDAAPVGLGGNPNFSGAHLALAVPLGLALRARTGDPRRRIGLLVAAVGLGIGAAWTGSAGAVLALVGGVAAASALDADLLPRPARIVALAAAAVLLVGAVLAVAGVEPPSTVPLASTLADTSGIEQRTNIWDGAASMVADHPLVGVGPDGFGRTMPHARSSRGGDLLITADEAHDIVLDRAATAGIPAALALVWLIASVGVAAWRARRTAAEEHRPLLAGFGGLVAAYVLQGLVSIDAVPLLLLGGLGTAALVALADPALVAARADAGARRPSRVAVPTAAAVGLVAAGLVLMALAVRPVVADRAHRRAVHALGAGRALSAYRADRSAASWVGEEPVYRAAQAQDLVAFAGRATTDAALRRSLLDEALVAYGDALERSPHDAGLQVSQAQAHLLAAYAAEGPVEAAEHLDAADGTYRRLLRTLPATDDLHLPYGRLLLAREEIEGTPGDATALDAASEQLEQAIGYRDHRVAATVELARVRVAQGDRAEARALLDGLTVEERDRSEVRSAIAEIERELDDGG